MRLALLSGLFAAACTLASPVTVERDTRVTVKRDNDGLEWISQDDTLPKVLCVIIPPSQPTIITCTRIFVLTRAQDLRCWRNYPQC